MRPSMLLTKVSGGTSRHLLPRIAVHALAPQCTTRGCHVISLRGSSQAPSVRFTSTLNRTCLFLHTTNHITRLATSCPIRSNLSSIATQNHRYIGLVIADTSSPYPGINHNLQDANDSKRSNLEEKGRYEHREEQVNERMEENVVGSVAFKVPV